MEVEVVINKLVDKHLIVVLVVVHNLVDGILLVLMVDLLRTLDLVVVAEVVTEMDLVNLDIQVVLVELRQYLEQSLLSV